MSERHYPIDAIGNRIREGRLVHVTNPQSGILAQVVKVEQAGMLRGPDGQAIAMDGKIHIAITMPYRPGKGLPGVLVIEQPNDEPRPLLVVNDKEAAERKQ